MADNLICTQLVRLADFIEHHKVCDPLPLGLSESGAKIVNIFETEKKSVEIFRPVRSEIFDGGGCALILLTRFSATPKKNYWQG